MIQAVRFLLMAVILFLGLITQAAEDYYLKSSEKAVLSLVLKSLTLPNSERLQLINRIYSRLEVSEKSKAHVVTVKTFEDFLKAYQNDPLFKQTQLSDLSTNDLFDEVKTTKYVSENKFIQKRINRYLEERKKFLADSLVKLGFLTADVFINTPSKNIEELTSTIEQFVTDKVDGLAAELNKNKSAQTEVLSLLLKLYYKNLPFNHKVEIFYQTLQLPLNSEPMDLFFTLLNNSGPQLQKLLQIIGRSPDIPAEFKSLFQKLESQVKPVHWRKVQKLLLEEGLKSSDFEYIEHKALGVGTMAQTHRAQLKINGQRKSLVIRFLKPGIAEALKMDYDILKQISSEIDSNPAIKKLGLPRLADLIDDLNKSVVEELDIAKTVEQQKNGETVYRRSVLIEFNSQKNFLDLIVPAADLIGKNKKIMTQELVFGSKPYKELSQYKEIYPDLYKKISEQIAEVWVEEVFFRSGFFHADLHQGNLLLQVTDPSIRLSLLDFGMTGQLDSVTQQSALLLALGIKLQQAELITKHFVLLSKSRTEPKDFAKKVQNRLKDLKKLSSPEASIIEWTTWALDQGIELDYEFIKLNRGLKAIEILLADAGSTMNFESIAKGLAFKNKAAVSKLLMNEKEIKIKDLTNLLGLVLPNAAKKATVRCEGLF